MKIRKISRRCLTSPKYPELGHFTLLFCRGRLKNVPLIEPLNLFFCRSRCRRRRGLLNSLLATDGEEALFLENQSVLVWRSSPRIRGKEGLLDI